MKYLAALIILFPLVAFADGHIEIAERADGPSVVELAVASSIADRQPADPGNSFPATVGNLYCWSKIKNTGEDTEVSHIWRHGDTIMLEKTLQIGKSPKWRTWTKRRINEKHTGEWSCEVVDANKESLGKVTFTVQ